VSLSLLIANRSKIAAGSSAPDEGESALNFGVNPSAFGISLEKHIQQLNLLHSINDYPLSGCRCSWILATEIKK
jgi:hypothetical protein